MRWILAIVLAFVLLALPAPAAPRTDSSTQTIRLISKTVRYRTLVDRPPKGEPNKGDVEWAKSILSNAVPQFGKPKGATVGSDIATLTVSWPRPSVET